jgi:hypothetical protein
MLDDDILLGFIGILISNIIYESRILQSAINKIHERLDRIERKLK